MSEVRVSLPESPRPEPRERVARAFTTVEDIVYIRFGLFLTGIAQG